MHDVFYQLCGHIQLTCATWQPRNRNQSNSIYATSTFQISTWFVPLDVKQNCASFDVSLIWIASRGHEKSRRYNSTRVRIPPRPTFFFRIIGPPYLMNHVAVCLRVFTTVLIIWSCTSWDPCVLCEIFLWTVLWEKDSLNAPFEVFTCN